VRWSANFYQAGEHANITNIGRRHFCLSANHSSCKSGTYRRQVMSRITLSARPPSQARSTGYGSSLPNFTTDDHTPTSRFISGSSLAI
jgi:hypothetical protein